MKTTHKIILGLSLLGLISCGGGNASSSKETIIQDSPKSPVLENKEKVPPSIPEI